MVRFKTWLFQNPEEVESACGFMGYCINMYLPIHTMRYFNTKQFKVVNTFYEDTLTASAIGKRLMWMPCERAQDHLLGLCISYLHFVNGSPSL